MKIACVAYLHGFGGAERQIIFLANQLASRHHEVHLIVLSEDKRCYDIDPKVIIHSTIQREKGKGFIKILNRRKVLISILQELKCNAVINFNFQSAYFLTLFNNQKLGKIIYAERSDPGDKEYTGILGLIRSFVLHRIDGYVFQSEGARDFFKDKYVNDHCAVIPNACFQKYNTIHSGKREKRIVTVGRLSPQKNQQLLINAFSFISPKFPDYYLEIYGDGELKEELEKLTCSLNLSNKVLFKGTVSNVSEKIKDASVFVLSSDYEGIPNALIEAMAQSLPCISTDCKPGGARTLIESGYNGLITPLGNANELAKSIEYLLSNPDEAEKMAQNAGLIVDRLSPQRIYDKWESFITSLV